MDGHRGDCIGHELRDFSMICLLRFGQGAKASKPVARSGKIWAFHDTRLLKYDGALGTFAVELINPAHISRF